MSLEFTATPNEDELIDLAIAQTSRSRMPDINTALKLLGEFIEVPLAKIRVCIMDNRTKEATQVLRKLADLIEALE